MYRTLCALLFAACIVQASAASPVSCSRVSGLFIGVAGREGHPPRPDAPAGARVLYDRFPSSERTLLLNEQATRSAVMDALRRLQALPPDECAVLFFSGPVTTTDEESGDQVGHLLLSDENALSLRYLRRLFEIGTAGGVLVLIDAGVGGLYGDPLTQSDTAGRSRLVLSAGGRDEIVPSSDEPSAFVQAVIAGLAHPQVSRMADYVSGAVPAATGNRQVPSFRSLLEGGGDMLLPFGRDDLPERPAITTRPKARLVVQASPETAVIQVEGAPVGRGAVETELPAGEVTVEVLVPGHARWIRRIYLRPGEVRTLTAEPILREAYLQLANLPPEATVRVDGDDVVSPETAQHIPSGRHRVEVAVPGRRTLRADLRLRAGEQGVIEFRERMFTPTILFRSALVPGWGQYRAGAYKEAILSGAATAGAGALAYIAHARFGRQNGAYRDATDAYHAAETPAEADRSRLELIEAFENARNADRIRRIAWSALAGVYGINLVDVFIRHARIPRLVVHAQSLDVEPRLSAAPDGASLGLTIRFQ